MESGDAVNQAAYFLPVREPVRKPLFFVDRRKGVLILKTVPQPASPELLLHAKLGTPAHRAIERAVEGD